MENKNQQTPVPLKDQDPPKDPISKNAGQTCGELDDDLLEGVSGGLVQLVNPSSSRL